MHATLEQLKAVVRLSVSFTFSTNYQPSFWRRNISMKRFLSLSVLLQAITGVMALALVVTFGIAAERAWKGRATALRVSAVASISRDRMDEALRARTRKVA